ncbi:MFS transporter [Murinocardiopsis flavida]|uniref:MFS transporter n=1 Tax=Murinocardiopsis flavida TaxID=645275 RepID=UPI001474A1C4|nr:MFS transporter [Murinocardiopsis flavida]
MTRPTAARLPRAEDQNDQDDTRTAEREGPAALRGFGLFTLLIGGFIATYTFSAVNVALPFIERDLSAPPAALQLVMGAYGSCFALLLIVGGRLGDMFGRHRLFGIGLAAFLVASVAAGLATDINGLVALRGLQGFAAALLMPQILATIQTATSGAARLRALGLFSMTAGIGTAAGQLIGGVLLSADIGGMGWRPVLWFAAVLAAAVLPGVFALPRTRSDAPGRPDVPGALTLGLGVLALLVPLSVGPSQGWPLWTVLLLAASPAALWVFWRWERRVEDRGRLPLVPPSVVRHRAVRLGLVMAGLIFASYGAFMYEFALVTQTGLGYSPLESGLSLTLCTLAYAFASVKVGFFERIFGTRVLAAGGVGIAVALVAIGAVVLLGWPHPSPWLLQPPLILFGCAQAMTFAPLVGTVMAEVPQSVAGLSGGLFSTVQQAALALGVAGYGSVYSVASHAPSLSFPGAFALCMAVQAVSITLFVVLAARLRRPTPN